MLVNLRTKNELQEIEKYISNKNDFRMKILPLMNTLCELKFTKFVNG